MRPGPIADGPDARRRRGRRAAIAAAGQGGRYPLPQIPDEGRMFNTAYSYPVNEAYAAGRMVLHGNFFLHGLDFRADPDADPPVPSVPAWAQKLAEPVRGLASRYQRDRDAALAAWQALGTAERQARLGDVLSLLEADDAAARISAARALAAPGLDAAKSGPALRATQNRPADLPSSSLPGRFSCLLSFHCRTVSLHKL